MARRVALDNVDHAHLRVAAGASSESVLVNQALVVPSEFEQLQREYPILFRRGEDEAFYAVAILGLDRDENLFWRNGEWISRYVPATFRRGPLLLDASETEQTSDPEILIDLDDPRVSDNGGELLFLQHGGAARFLQQAVEALKTMHEGVERSRLMFSLFVELGLIVPVEIDVDLGDGRHYRLADLFTIGAEQFSGLSGGALERLNRAGFLAPAVHARASLANINRLIELKTHKLEHEAAVG